MAVVDASVIAAMFLDTDVQHQLCLNYYAAALQAGEELSAPALLLLELKAAMARRRIEHAQIEAAAQEVQLGIVMYPVSADLLRRAEAVAVQCATRAADSLYIALAMQLGEELVTTDEEQAERGSCLAVTHDLLRDVVRRPQP
jgi:predicted nucleic acid-binding protein